MRSRTAILLAAVALVCAALVWFSTIERASSPAETGTLMFPGLAARLQDAARIEVSHQAQTLAVVRNGDVWGLADRAGYPVQSIRVRELLTGLTELRLTEPRTSDAAEYGRLGVEDMTAANATSNMLRVLDAKGGKLVELIVGHRRTRTRADVPDTVYVRRPGESQAWLAEGRLPVDADAQLWLDRDILDVGQAQIARVDVTRGEEQLAFIRSGDKLTLAKPAEHGKLDDYKLEDVGRALEALTLTDVEPVADMPGVKIATSRFTTTDGLVIDVSLFRADQEVWAQFATHGDDSVKPRAVALQARIGSWAYQLGAWKEKALAPTLADLTAAEPEPGTTK